MGIEKRDINDLLVNGIIDKETANNIENYIKSMSKIQHASSRNSFLLIIGSIGASLIGLGIILLLAANWHMIPKFTQVALALAPLLVSQLLLLYQVYNNKENHSTENILLILNYFGLGTAIALVSRIYHIPGDFDNFLLVWYIAMLPYVYLFKSKTIYFFSAVMLLFWYASSGFENNLGVVGLAMFLSPAIYKIKIEKHSSVTKVFIYNWLMLISTLALINSFESHIILRLLFGALLLNGIKEYYLNDIPNRLNLFRISRFFIIILLGIFSFKYMLNEILHESIVWTWDLILLGLSSLGIYFINYKKIDKDNTVYLFIGKFLVLSLILSDLISDSLWIGIYILSNILFIAFGIFEVYQGIQQNKLVKLNYGLLVISAFILVRFFDAFESISMRGILFLLMGTSFLAINMYYGKKLKVNK